jgi:RNA polymerase sigma factor (TIGR02999 family)
MVFPMQTCSELSFPEPSTGDEFIVDFTGEFSDDVDDDLDGERELDVDISKINPANVRMADVDLRAQDIAPVDVSKAQTGILFTTLYDDLRRLARREVRRNGALGMVGTSTLVHEAWMDISRRPSLAFEEPGRFLAYAARTMRGLVIDRIRAQHAQKRGGGFIITSLDTHNADQVVQPEVLENIGEALDELATLEPALAHVVDLKFFCGFTLAEVATMQGVSERTVQRQWEKARLLLYRALRSD